MHKYCLDTSGLSNPYLELPEDIFVSLWPKIIAKVNGGVFCWNVEISEELERIPGAVGESLKLARKSCCYEVGVGNWPWDEYIRLINRWRTEYRQFISEDNGNRKNTININDMSIVALAKTLELPVVSMERRNLGPPSQSKLRIPDLCDRESIGHLSFNNFLQAESITV